MLFFYFNPFLLEVGYPETSDKTVNASLLWKVCLTRVEGAASACACGSSRRMGPDLGHYSSRIVLARDKQSIHIFCKVTFADEIVLLKIFDLANMRQCHWIRDKWFVLLDILLSNKTFRSAFQVINEILPLFKMFRVFLFFILFIWDIFLIYSRRQQHLLTFHDYRVLVW